jgi:hypothetical protein
MGDNMKTLEVASYGKYGDRSTSQVLDGSSGLCGKTVCLFIGEQH